MLTEELRQYVNRVQQCSYRLIPMGELMPQKLTKALIEQYEEAHKTLHAANLIGTRSVHEDALEADRALRQSGISDLPPCPPDPGAFLAWISLRGWTKRG